MDPRFEIGTLQQKGVKIFWNEERMEHGTTSGNKCIPTERGFVTFGILLAQWSETITNPPISIFHWILRNWTSLLYNNSS